MPTSKKHSEKKKESSDQSQPKLTEPVESKAPHTASFDMGSSKKHIPDATSTSSPKQKGPDKSNFHFLIASLIIIAIIGGIFAMKFFQEPVDLGPSLILDAPEIKFFEYNNYTFNWREGKWHVALFDDKNRAIDVPLRFSPRDMQDLTIEGEYDEDNFGKGGVFISFDPNTAEEFGFIALGAAELSLSLNGVLAITPSSACTTNDTDVEDCLTEPIANCDSENKSVIVLVDSEIEAPKITYDGTCVTIEGKDYDLVKGVDRLLYSWFNVLDFYETPDLI